MGSETHSNLKSVITCTTLNDIPGTITVDLPDGPHPVEIFFTGDHMCHHRMGECDAPTASARGRHLCPYCPAPVREIKNVFLNKRRHIEEEVKEGALLPNIHRHHRVPDLLHCIKNVVKFFLKKGSETFYPDNCSGP